MPLFDYQDEIVEAPPTKQDRGGERSSGTKSTIRKRRKWPFIFLMIGVLSTAYLIMKEL